MDSQSGAVSCYHKQASNASRDLLKACAVEQHLTREVVAVVVCQLAPHHQLLKEALNRRLVFEK